jgi:hypothetical protein
MPRLYQGRFYPLDLVLLTHILNWTWISFYTPTRIVIHEEETGYEDSIANENISSQAVFHLSHVFGNGRKWTADFKKVQLDDTEEAKWRNWLPSLFSSVP